MKIYSKKAAKTYSKKAQLEINETILVIFIFTILLITGLVVFHRLNINSIKNEELENQRTNLNTLLNTIPNMPEIKCSSQTKLTNCVDAIKLFSFKKLANNNYIENFGFKKITIRTIYPKKTNKECSKLEFQNPEYPSNCNFWVLYDRQPNNIQATEIVSSPVSLYYPLQDKHVLALLTITWFR